MLGSISSFFENCLKLNSSDTEENTEEKLHLACAALMLELCNADQSMDDTEQRALVGILRKIFHLDDEALENLWQLAHEEARSATSLFQFTSLINDTYGYKEKVLLLKSMWEVAYADGRLDRYEEHLIRKVADLLYLSHGDFIRTKLACKPVDAS